MGTIGVAVWAGVAAGAGVGFVGTVGVAGCATGVDTVGAPVFATGFKPFSLSAAARLLIASARSVAVIDTFISNIVDFLLKCLTINKICSRII
jgi:hypothetical protein